MVRYPDRWEKFGYDPAGNRKSRVTGEVEENYAYDARNRLLQVIRTAGNGTSLLAEGILAGTAEDGYGTVKATEEVWRYEYDRQGNLLKDNYAKYSYDGFNRMEKAEINKEKTIRFIRGMTFYVLTASVQEHIIIMSVTKMVVLARYWTKQARF